MNHVLIAAVFEHQHQARLIVEELIEQNFPMDQISLLSKSGGPGDDLLGITYDDTREKMKTWGLLGAFWGGLWALLASAAGLFVFPGVGAVLAAGPIVEAISAVVAGAALSGGVMAGAAAVSQLAVVLHRIGIPEDKIQLLHDDITNGCYLLILHSQLENDDRQLDMLRRKGAKRVLKLFVAV